MWKCANRANAKMPVLFNFYIKELAGLMYLHIHHISTLITLEFTLFNQSRCIAGKDFYGNGQQYYAKKFSDSNQTGRTQ